jgi:S-methylmethionine-dependent homocysteine/selenocysteine methylase
MSYAAIAEKLDRGAPVILDGAIGTEILRRDVTWADHQLLSRPEVVRAIHADYLAAGAEVLSTNTFQLTRRAFLNHFKDREHMRHLGAPDLEARWADLLRAGVTLAREARAAARREGSAAVAGAMTTLEWCFRPDLAPSPEQALAEYREIISVFAEAGADMVLVETVNAVAEAAVAARAAREVGLPCWLAFVPDQQGRLFSGESLVEAAAALAPLGVGAILLNCAPPPDALAGLHGLKPAWRGAAGIYPHIGRFDPPEWLFTGEYPPDQYADEARGWLAEGATIVGGCCGTTPDHIAALRSLVAAAH